VRAETSKSHRNRRVRLDPLAANAVHLYTKDWRPEAAGSVAPLFLTERAVHVQRLPELRPPDRRSLQGRGRGALDGPSLSSLLGDEQPPQRDDDLRHRVRGRVKDSEMVRRYNHDRPFEELQAMPTALTAMLRRRAS
jgi:hypothetical protein